MKIGMRGNGRIIRDMEKVYIDLKTACSIRASGTKEHIREKV